VDWCTFLSLISSQGTLGVVDSHLGLVRGEGTGMACWEGLAVIVSWGRRRPEWRAWRVGSHLRI
jgi:hypothetical protein